MYPNRRNEQSSFLTIRVAEQKFTENLRGTREALEPPGTTAHSRHPGTAAPACSAMIETGFGETAAAIISILSPGGH
jgi:hypothetical protein